MAKQSLRDAINKFCTMCIFDEEDGNGTVQEQIRSCVSYTCPLFKVRPYQKGTSNENMETCSNGD